MKRLTLNLATFVTSTEAALAGALLYLGMAFRSPLAGRPELIPNSPMRKCVCAHRSHPPEHCWSREALTRGAITLTTIRPIVAVQIPELTPLLTTPTYRLVTVDKSHWLASNSRCVSGRFG